MSDSDVPARFEAVLRRAFPRFTGPFRESLAAADVPGWNSVAHVNLLMDVEDEFGIEIPPEAAAEIPDVGGLIGIIRQGMAA